MVNKRHPDMPVSLDSSVTDDAKLSQLPSQLSSLYGLTPKVESAIIDALSREDTGRLNMLMDPLHPADKADFIKRINHQDTASLVQLVGLILMSKFWPILMKMHGRLWLSIYLRM